MPRQAAYGCGLRVSEIALLPFLESHRFSRNRFSRGQIKVIGAIRACRTAALGGHVARCEGCDHVEVAYNSCRNRHCPKCQRQAARIWLERRQADLLPVPYYYVVFILPAPFATVAFQNKAVVYDLLLRTSADTLLTTAVDPKPTATGRASHTPFPRRRRTSAQPLANPTAARRLSKRRRLDPRPLPRGRRGEARFRIDL